MKQETPDIIGMTTEVRICNFYAANGLVVCQILDPSLQEMARVQARAHIQNYLQEKLTRISKSSNDY